MTYLYVFIGGGAGCLARFGIGQLANHYMKSTLPIGTFMSNMVACALLALFVLGTRHYSAESSWIQPLLIIGFCGGFSTFSTFSYESVQLIEQGNTLIAILNILISVGVGIGLIFLIRGKV